MDLAQLTELVLNGKIADAHIDLFVVLLSVIRVDFLNDLTGHGIETGKYLEWLLCEPNSDCWLLGS